MGSGLIYATIVVVWVAVLIPMWLRHHDEISESRSADRFSRAMHILSRREPAGPSRYVVMPRRPAGATGAVLSDGPVGSAALAPGRPSRGRSGPRRRPSLAVRRRRVLAALGLATVLLVVAAPVSPLPWWVAAAMALLTVGYVVHLRVQARRRVALRRRRSSASRTASARLRRLASADRVFAVRSDRFARQLEEVRAAAEEATRSAAAMVASQASDRSSSSVASDGWAPVPVPLPTYVTKPKAVRTARTIDVTSPGVWSSAAGHDDREAYDDQPFDNQAYDAQAYDAQALDEADGDDELDAILDRRRVVND